MKRIASFVCCLSLAAMLLAADKPVVGSWQCVSDSPDGEQYRWTVVVKDEGGKLSGTISGAPGEYVMVEPRFENGTLTFKVQIEGETYTIEARIRGDQFEGVWKGASSQGYIKGTRQS